MTLRAANLSRKVPMSDVLEINAGLSVLEVNYNLNLKQFIHVTVTHRMPNDYICL